MFHDDSDNFNYNTYKLPSEMMSVAQNIVESTSYSLLPTRILCPNKYKYAASTLDGKKEILLSLSQMLIDAEKARKLDSEACETFTRCRSRSGKGKEKYEYVDVDIQTVVDPMEFERRFAEHPPVHNYY